MSWYQLTSVYKWWTSSQLPIIDDTIFDLKMKKIGYMGFVSWSMDGW